MMLEHEHGIQLGRVAEVRVCGEIARDLDIRALSALEPAKQLEDRGLAENDRAVALLSPDHARGAADARAGACDALGAERGAVAGELLALGERACDARPECGVIDRVEE